MTRFALVALLLAVLAPAAVGATQPIPRKRVAAYCSPSGDLCYGIFRKGADVELQITTAARYFTRYRLCVRPPTGAQTCRNVPIRMMGEQQGSVVKWNKNFPNKGRGTYRVTWSQRGTKLGPLLRFTQR
jgi:hypothetical protein